MNLISFGMNLFRDLSLTKTEFLIGVFSFLLFAASVFGSRQLRISADDALYVATPFELKLAEDVDLNGLIHQLKLHQVDFHEAELRWVTRLLGWRNFKRGNYLLDGEYSYEVLLEKLAKGIQTPVSVVVLPGITPQLFSRNVAAVLAVDSSEIHQVLQDSAFLAETGLSKENLFGRMLPETYLMYWTTSPKNVVRRILREFDNKVVEPYAEIAEAQGKSINDILTLASIVEWEAKLEEEKPVIAGLYWNRLNRGMRLEADPTVNFALSERRRLLFEDYKIDHPFNTYKHKGLPPGPITNPDLNSIKAALYPEEHNYLYMVANPEGGHVFSRTFTEHQKASEEWRRWLREQYRIARQREQAQNK